ncbi:MAG: phospholipase, partial [Acidobacteriota bacterium]|nr:phospholipase [Acidobacteriota bacterium]
MRSFMLATGTAGFLLLASGLSSSPPGQGTFQQRTLALGPDAYRYQVFLPVGWQPQKSWPVVLFLHGNGERGDDGWRQTLVGIG